MPLFYQHQVDDNTRLGIWKIEETENFFKGNVPQHRDVTHPHKRLQHLAGRFLLQYLFPGFPYELVRIADTRKPYLPDEEYHFSISHCGDFAAAIVSTVKRVGIDIEVPLPKIARIADKFLSNEEKKIFDTVYEKQDQAGLTLLWSCKETVFKWYGRGGVDFREHIHLHRSNAGMQILPVHFTPTNSRLDIYYQMFEQLVLTWVADDG